MVGRIPGDETGIPGPYRLVGHPMYLGVILVATGMPVFVPSLAGFLIMLALIPILLIRIRIEERLLADEFGAEYQAYQRNTPKLIPFIF